MIVVAAAICTAMMIHRRIHVLRPGPGIYTHTPTHTYIHLHGNQPRWIQLAHEQLPNTVPRHTNTDDVGDAIK